MDLIKNVGVCPAVLSLFTSESENSIGVFMVGALDVIIFFKIIYSFFPELL